MTRLKSCPENSNSGLPSGNKPTAKQENLAVDAVTSEPVSAENSH
jgi:hypothetical protein